MRIVPIILSTAVVGTAVGWAAAVIQFRSDIDKPPPAAGDTAATRPASLGRAPQIEVGEREFDFGTMQRGAKKSHAFVVKNVGAAPLTLRMGHTTCKCTLGMASEAPLAPGESTEVRLDWIANADAGPFRQTATLLTNDPQNLQVSLAIVGEVVAAHGIEPHEFLFDKLSAGESKAASVFVLAMFENEISVDRPEFTAAEGRDYYEVRIEPVGREELPNPAAKAGVRVTVTVKPGLPLGALSQKLRLHTSLPDTPDLEIPLVGRVIGDISVHGPDWDDARSIVQIGKVKSSQGSPTKRLNVLIRGPSAENVRLNLASVDPAELKVTIGEPRRLRESLVQIPVEIVVPPGLPPMVRLGTDQGDDGRVILGTTHPTVRELAIGVRFSVER